MPQQSQYEGVMRVPADPGTTWDNPSDQGPRITSNVSAFDPGGGGFPKSSGGAVPSSPRGQATASQIFSPDVDPSQGTLPGGGGGSQQDTFATLNALMGQSSALSDAEIMKAITPVSGAAPVQMPPYFTRQLPKPGELIQDTTPQVGAGNARAQGIGNSINAVIHGIAQFKSQRDQTQQTVDATKVQRLIEVQNGISQAQQVLNTTKPGDPNSEAIRAEAQKTLDHNNGLMAQMLSDKKFSKLVEKGFNISLTDPSANKTPEHGAVQRGIDMFKKANNQPYTPQQAQQMAQRFQAQQPQQLGPNVMAQQLLQYRVMEQQQWQKLVQSILPRMFTARSQMELENTREGFREFIQTRQFANQAIRDGMKWANDQSMAQIRHNYRLDEIQAHVRQTYEAMQQNWMDRNIDPSTLFKQKTAFTQKAMQIEQGFRGALAQNLQATGALQAARATTTDAGEKALIDQRLKDLRSQYDSLIVQQSNWDSYKDSWYQQMKRLEELSGGGGGQSGPGPTGPTSGQPGPGGSGAFNPQSLLNNVPAGIQPAQPGTGALPPVAGGAPAGEDNPDDEDDEDLSGVYGPAY